MKLSAMEGTAILLLAGVVAYSAGTVTRRGDDTTAGLAGDWQARFTMDHAYPPRENAVGRTVAARVHIGAAPPSPSRSTSDARPHALEGDLRAFGIGGGDLRGARVHAARGDSMEVTLGSGPQALVLVGRLECGRMAGRWRHASRVEMETGHFELRRAHGTGWPASRASHLTGDRE